MRFSVDETFNPPSYIAQIFIMFAHMQLYSYKKNVAS